MKFRDPKTGEVFEDIHQAKDAYCTGKECVGSCALMSNAMLCYRWVEDNPAEAADRMGYEVVEDSKGVEIDPDKASFVCQRLGVKPGQPFICHGYPGRNYPPLAYVDGIIRQYAPDGRHGFKVGGRATIWMLEHPENIEPREGYSLREVAFKKEDPMEKTDKPRICEVLGVEVGEEWHYKNDLYHIRRSDEKLYVLCGDAWDLVRDAEIVQDIIKHLDCIIHKIHFDDDEMAILKSLYTVGARWIARGDKHLRWYARKPFQRAVDGKWDMKGDLGTMSGKLPAKLFPSLRPGQSISLEELCNEEREA